MLNPSNNQNEINYAHSSTVVIPSRDEKYAQRIHEVRLFESSEESHPYGKTISQCKHDLAHLIGPTLAAPFLQMLEPFKYENGDEMAKGTIDDLFNQYNAEVVLMDALSRMIRLMVNAYGNGESCISDVCKSGNLVGVELIHAVIARLEILLEEERKHWFYHVSNLKYPAYVMNDIHWSFQGGEFFSRANFDDALRINRLQICMTSSWYPEMICVLAKSIEINVWEYGKILDFESDNGRWFTEGELLFKINNALADDMAENEYGYSRFEGLNLLSKCEEDNHVISKISLC